MNYSLDCLQTSKTSVGFLQRLVNLEKENEPDAHKKVIFVLYNANNFNRKD